MPQRIGYLQAWNSNDSSDGISCQGRWLDDLRRLVAALITFCSIRTMHVASVFSVNVGPSDQLCDYDTATSCPRLAL